MRVPRLDSVRPACICRCDCGKVKNPANRSQSQHGTTKPRGLRARRPGRATTRRTNGTAGERRFVDCFQRFAAHLQSSGSFYRSRSHQSARRSARPRRLISYCRRKQGYYTPHIGVSVPSDVDRIKRETERTRTAHRDKVCRIAIARPTPPFRTIIKTTQTWYRGPASIRALGLRARCSCKAHAPMFPE